MSSSMFITIDSKDFPNDINGINNLFRQANKIYGEFEYRYYLILNMNLDVKAYISDLNIQSIKIDIANKSNVQIFAEKLLIKDSLPEKVIPNMNKIPFEDQFQTITNEVLDSLKNNGNVDINAIWNKHNVDKTQFENLEKIIIYFNAKINLLEKEKAIASIIVSDLEDTVNKYINENETIKMKIEKMNIVQILGESEKSKFYDENCVKIDSIIQCLNKLHKDFYERKEFFDGVDQFLNESHFNNNGNIPSKLNEIENYLKRFIVEFLKFLDSININKLYLYHKEILKKRIFCNLCNNFKKNLNNEFKMCDRHLICENCFKNYGKKIKCIKDKLCYCKTEF